MDGGGIVQIGRDSRDQFISIKFTTRDGRVVLSEDIPQALSATSEDRANWVVDRIEYIESQYPGIWQFKRNE